MSDYSDDGGPLPGESYYVDNSKNIENEEQNIYNSEYNNEQVSSNENYYNYNYDNKFNNYDNNYDNNYVNNYNNYEQDFEEDSIQNNKNDDNHNYDYDDSNYNDNYDNDRYNDYYENNNYNNDFNINSNHKKKFNGKNSKIRNNYHHNPINNIFSGNHKIIRNKEYYFSSFEQKFILWLMIVIKKLSNEDKLEKIKFDENDKVNKEIIESFLRKYDYEKDNNNKNKENENNKNNLKIRIENTKTEKILSNDYNIEFNIIISDEKEIYFIKKYIEIKVIGEIYYNKYPKFFFQVKQYKLSLLNEGIKYIQKIEEKSEEGKKQDKNNEKEKGEKDNNKNSKPFDGTILNIENNEENGNKCIIGMCPKYGIEDTNFKKLYMDLKKEISEENDKKEKIKGPQQEIRDYLFEISEIIKNENN